MKKRYVPLGKRSKREQREHNAARRAGWGGVNPVTKKIPNAKIYDRKKSGRGYDYDPPGFFNFLYKRPINSSARIAAACGNKYTFN